jgi:hypothetical protein
MLYEIDENAKKDKLYFMRKPVSFIKLNFKFNQIHLLKVGILTKLHRLFFAMYQTVIA